MKSFMVAVVVAALREPLGTTALRDIALLSAVAFISSFSVHAGNAIKQPAKTSIISPVFISVHLIILNIFYCIIRYRQMQCRNTAFQCLSKNKHIFSLLCSLPQSPIRQRLHQIPCRGQLPVFPMSDPSQSGSHSWDWAQCAPDW